MTKKNNDGQSKPGPLDGIKIVEYGVFHAGPGANAILGDLGAEVIKIEAASGDPLRLWTKSGERNFSLPNGEGLLFEVSNRNKQGICLDIKSEKGYEIFLDMIKDADIFLTNLRKSTKKKLAIDYDTLSKTNPKLIHANISGYGPEGPLNNMGAFDPMCQGRSGMMYITGSENPMLIQYAVLDQATAIAASQAIMTALFIRERQGIGQEIHISLYSTAIWLLHFNMLMTSMLSENPNVPWIRSSNSPLRNNFQCKDGKWIIGVHHPEEKYWKPFCMATNKESLIDDPRFIDFEHRIKNCKELIAIFDEVFETKTRNEWMEILPDYGLMFTSVQDISEVLDDPQALENDYVVDFDYHEFGSFKIPGYPVHFSTFQAGTKTGAPKIGEHTDLIMGKMGYTAEQIDELRKEGIIN